MPHSGALEGLHHGLGHGRGHGQPTAQQRPPGAGSACEISSRVELGAVQERIGIVGDGAGQLRAQGAKARETARWRGALRADRRDAHGHRSEVAIEQRRLRGEEARHYLIGDLPTAAQERGQLERAPRHLEALGSDPARILRRELRAAQRSREGGGEARFAGLDAHQEQVALHQVQR